MCIYAAEDKATALQLHFYNIYNSSSHLSATEAKTAVYFYDKSSVFYQHSQASLL